MAEPSADHNHEAGKLTQHQRRTMAPWQALLIVWILCAGSWMAFEWTGRGVSKELVYFMGASGIAALAATLGTMGARLMERITGKTKTGS